jgi:hypothetical protein
MKAKCAGVKIFGPLWVRGDGSYVVNAADGSQVWLRFHQQWLRTLYKYQCQKSEMARGKLIRGNHGAQLRVKKGRWPHAIGPVSARLRMRREKAHFRKSGSVWGLDRDLFRRAEPQNASPYHFHSQPVPR